MKELYFSLFESHLSYCISVWGGASAQKLNPLWILQKRCCRIVFGDKEAYLDKFRTCARTRDQNSQLLDGSFYVREHTKPLFKENSFLSIYNLFNYHTFMETFKILKFRTPMCLFENYEMSNLKETRIKYHSDSESYTKRSGKIWNTIFPKVKIMDFAVNVSQVRHQLKSIFASLQHRYNPDDWSTEDFNLNKI